MSCCVDCQGSGVNHGGKEDDVEDLSPGRETVERVVAPLSHLLIFTRSTVGTTFTLHSESRSRKKTTSHHFLHTTMHASVLLLASTLVRSNHNSTSGSYVRANPRRH